MSKMQLATSPLVAFRCQDGTYLLAPHAASIAWFENPSVEFLGDVVVESFERTVALKIEGEIDRWNFALISKHEFHFSWSHAQERTRDEPQAREATSGAVAAPLPLNEHALVSERAG